MGASVNTQTKLALRMRFGRTFITVCFILLRKPQFANHLSESNLGTVREQLRGEWFWQEVITTRITSTQLPGKFWKKFQRFDGQSQQGRCLALSLGNNGVSIGLTRERRRRRPSPAYILATR